VLSKSTIDIDVDINGTDRHDSYCDIIFHEWLVLCASQWQFCWVCALAVMAMQVSWQRCCQWYGKKFVCMWRNLQAQMTRSSHPK